MEKLNPNYRNNDYDDAEVISNEENEFVADVSNYVPAPAGNHLARCIGFIALGTHEGDYRGKKGLPRKKIMLLWELPEALHVFNEDEGETPFLVSQIYSLVISDKATYTIHMQGWTGGRIDKNFNPLTMVGKPCQVNIIHKSSDVDPEKIRPKISTIMGLTKNQPCPDRINLIKILTFNRWNENLFNEQSDWIKKMIENSPEYKKMKAGEPLVEGNNEGQWQKKPDSVKNESDLPF